MGFIPLLIRCHGIGFFWGLGLFFFQVQPDIGPHRIPLVFASRFIDWDPKALSALTSSWSLGVKQDRGTIHMTYQGPQGPLDFKADFQASSWLWKGLCALCFRLLGQRDAYSETLSLRNISLRSQTWGLQASRINLSLSSVFGFKTYCAAIHQKSLSTQWPFYIEGKIQNNSRGWHLEGLWIPESQDRSQRGEPWYLSLKIPTGDRPWEGKIQTKQASFLLEKKTFLACKAAYPFSLKETVDPMRLVWNISLPDIDCRIEDLSVTHPSTGWHGTIRGRHVRLPGSNQTLGQQGFNATLNWPTAGTFATLEAHVRGDLKEYQAIQKAFSLPLSFNVLSGSYTLKGLYHLSTKENENRALQGEGSLILDKANLSCLSLHQKLASWVKLPKMDVSMKRMNGTLNYAFLDPKKMTLDWKGSGELSCGLATKSFTTRTHFSGQFHTQTGRPYAFCSEINLDVPKAYLENQKLWIWGPNTLTVPVKVSTRNVSQWHVESDLTDQSFLFPWIDWKKAQGIPVIVSAHIGIQDGGLSCQLKAAGDHRRITGETTVNSRGVYHTYDLQDPRNVLQFKADLRNGQSYHVQGQCGNFSPILSHIKALIRNPSTTPARSPLTVSWSLEKLWIHNHLFGNTSGFLYGRYNPLYQKVTFSEVRSSLNQLDGRSFLNLRFQESEGGSLYLANLGDLLSLLEVSQEVNGGECWLSILPPHKQEMKAEALYPMHFRIQNTALLYQKMGTGSWVKRFLAGLSPLAPLEWVNPFLWREPQRGLWFQSIEGQMRFSWPTLQLQTLEGEGPRWGLNLKGHVDLKYQECALEGILAPTNFMNTILHKTPLIGWLLFHKKNPLFGTVFWLEGSIYKPSFRFNPLSTWTPSFLRYFVRSFQMKPTRIRKAGSEQSKKIPRYKKRQKRSSKVS